MTPFEQLNDACVTDGRQTDDPLVAHVIRPILDENVQHQKRYLLLILELYWADIPTTLNWLNIWNTPLTDIGMMSEYNRYILANIMRNIPYWLNFG